MNIGIICDCCVGCEKCGRKELEPLLGFNVPLANELVLRLSNIRVLRSSCSDSNEGEFRVHLPEKDWNEIQRLVKELEK